MSKAQEAADAQRQGAKVLMRRLLGIQEGESNGMAEQLVDSIINAAMLEAVIVITKGMQEQVARNDANRATSDNP